MLLRSVASPRFHRHIDRAIEYGCKTLNDCAVILARTWGDPESAPQQLERELQYPTRAATVQDALTPHHLRLPLPSPRAPACPVTCRSVSALLRLYLSPWQDSCCSSMVSIHSRSWFWRKLLSRQSCVFAVLPSCDLRPLTPLVMPRSPYHQATWLMWGTHQRRPALLRPHQAGQGSQSHPRTLAHAVPRSGGTGLGIVL